MINKFKTKLKKKKKKNYILRCPLWFKLPLITRLGFFHYPSKVTTNRHNKHRSYKLQHNFLYLQEALLQQSTVPCYITDFAAVSYDPAEDHRAYRCRYARRLYDLHLWSLVKRVHAAFCVPVIADSCAHQLNMHQCAHQTLPPSCDFWAMKAIHIA